MSVMREPGAPGPARVVRDWDRGTFLVVSHPPLYRATVKPAGMHFSVSLGAFTEPVYRKSLESALMTGQKLVSALALKAWREQMTGPQRTAVGQQKCPFRVGEPLCLGVIVPGSIWCPDHDRSPVWS